jgi:spermidine synthase
VATIWQKTSRGKQYEVRTAGSSLRLYTDGVFHTQYNPRQIFTGSVWDLLVLPAFLKRDNIHNVLLLGVGGGAVIHQLLEFFPIRGITAVDLDETHLYVAKRFFDIKDERVKLVNADAQTWLQRNRTKKFDLIIDDVFGEENGEPTRAIEADADWFSLNLYRLNLDGIFVSNFASNDELKHCGFYSHARIRNQFKSAFSMSTPYSENRIAAFLKFKTDPAELKKELQKNETVAQALKSKKIRYRARNLK